MLVNSAAVIGVGVMIFPILTRHHEISAYGYLSAQLVQGVMRAVGIALLPRIPLAQQHPGARDGSVLSAPARVAQEANHYSVWIAGWLLTLAGVCRAPGRAGWPSGWLAWRERPDRLVPGPVPGGRLAACGCRLSAGGGVGCRCAAASRFDAASAGPIRWLARSH